MTYNVTDKLTQPLLKIATGLAKWMHSAERHNGNKIGYRKGGEHGPIDGKAGTLDSQAIEPPTFAPPDIVKFRDCTRSCGSRVYLRLKNAKLS